MKAIILAAGRGERMRPLTDHTPKPLLKVQGKPLIEWHLEALARDGIRDVVINTAWLEDQIVAALGDGSRWGQRIHYSMEGRDYGGALETAGGIATALPWLADGEHDAFWVVSGDVFMPGFMFDQQAARRFESSDALAHLWMVPNPAHHPLGDFGIDAENIATLEGEPRRTWSSVGLYRAAMFAPLSAGSRAPLRPLLNAAIADRRIGATLYRGPWADVGTPDRLAALNDAATPPAAR